MTRFGAKNASKGLKAGFLGRSSGHDAGGGDLVDVAGSVAIVAEPRVNTQTPLRCRLPD